MQLKPSGLTVVSGDIGSRFFMSKQIEICMVLSIQFILPCWFTGVCLTVYMICRYLYFRGKDHEYG